VSLANAIADPIVARAVRELEAKVEQLAGALMVGRGSPEGVVKDPSTLAATIRRVPPTASTNRPTPPGQNPAPKKVRRKPGSTIRHVGAPKATSTLKPDHWSRNIPNSPKPPAATAGTPPQPTPGPPAGVGPVDPLALQAGDSAATVAGIGNAQYGYDVQQAQLHGQERRTRLDIGMAEVGPGTPGAIKDPASGRYFALDIPNNPYSQAAKLKQTFDARRRGTRTNDAAGGFLFDGVSLSNDLATERAAGEANHSLAQSFLDSMAGINAQRTQAHTDLIDKAVALRAGEAETESAEIREGIGTPSAGERPDMTGETPQKTTTRKPRKRGKRGGKKR
jgi:hypothetical protein